MSTHVPGFLPFSALVHHFVLAKLAISSIRVNPLLPGDKLDVCLDLSYF